MEIKKPEYYNEPLVDFEKCAPFNPKMLNRYLHTFLERYTIYIKKGMPEKMFNERPWTEDTILDKFSFTNSFRQYDKCSKWMIDKIIRPYTDHKDLWKFIIIYRYISSFNIYNEMDRRGLLLDVRVAEDVIANMYKRGELTFNRCFLRNPHTSEGTLRAHQVPFTIIRDIEKDGRINDVISEQSYEKLVNYLQRFTGNGPFMSNQYALDMAYSNQFNPTDRNTYAAMGPGSKRGMNYLLGEASEAPLSQRRWLNGAIMLHHYLKTVWSQYACSDGSVEYLEYLHIQEVQNWCCEFGKYVRILGQAQNNLRIIGKKYKVTDYEKVSD